MSQYKSLFTNVQVILILKDDPVYQSLLDMPNIVKISGQGLWETKMSNEEQPVCQTKCPVRALPMNRLLSA